MENLFKCLNKFNLRINSLLISHLYNAGWGPGSHPGILLQWAHLQRNGICTVEAGWLPAEKMTRDWTLQPSCSVPTQRRGQGRCCWCRSLCLGVGNQGPTDHGDFGLTINRCVHALYHQLCVLPEEQQPPSNGHLSLPALWSFRRPIALLSKKSSSLMGMQDDHSSCQPTELEG